MKMSLQCAYSRILELITSGNVICNFVVTFIQQKDDGWLRRGGSYGLEYKVYLFIDTHQLVAEVTATKSSNLDGSVGSGHVLGIV